MHTLANPLVQTINKCLINSVVMMLQILPMKLKICYIETKNKNVGRLYKFKKVVVGYLILDMSCYWR